MKKLIILLAVAGFAFTGCENYTAQIEQLKQEKDSVIAVVGQKDAQLGEFVNAVSDIENNLSAITEKQGSIKEAIKFGQKIDEDIFIIGGGNIFEQTMDIADKLEVTEIKTNIEADTFFPKIDPKIWTKTDEICHEKDEKNNFDFCFQTFQRGK